MARTTPFIMKKYINPSITSVLKHYATLIRITPASVMNVPIIFERVNFSLRKKNPIRIANKIDVSRIAITTAIGAFEKAHITIA